MQDGSRIWGLLDMILEIDSKSDLDNCNCFGRDTTPPYSDIKIVIHLQQYSRCAP